ncbi:MAG: hypothetical protein ACOY5B_16735 [Spirochaetota bacterium]
MANSQMPIAEPHTEGEFSMKKIAHISCALMTVFAVSGCATFLTLEKPDDTNKAVLNGQKRTLTIVYSQYQQTDKEMEKAREQDRLITEKRIKRILEETNLFSEVKVAEDVTVPGNSDLTIKFTALTKVNNQVNPLRILSFVTLGLIPMQFTQETKLTGEVLDKTGKKFKTTEGSFQSSTWIGWFILPLAPFYSPDSQADKAFKAMIDEAMQALAKDKIL